MLSKSQIKYIRSLQRKKLRHIHKAYIVEGEKIIHEYLSSNATVISIYATGDWLRKNQGTTNQKKIEIHEITEAVLRQISVHKTPQGVVGLVKMPENKLSNLHFDKGLHLVLENIQDPGNLGTIIRIADWFGIENVICSPDCVDVYNPKVVQSTMGSLSRMNVLNADLHTFLQDVDTPVFATTLDGENAFECKHPDNAIIIIGNESKGISQDLLELASHKISIPKFGKAESLNAAVATAIIVSWFRNTS